MCNYFIRTFKVCDNAKSVELVSRCSNFMHISIITFGGNSDREELEKMRLFYKRKMFIMQKGTNKLVLYILIFLVL